MNMQSYAETKWKTVMVKNRNLVTICLALAVFAALLAATPTVSPAATPKTATTPQSPAGWEAKWGELKAAAAKEGKIVIGMGGSSARDYRAVWESFGKQFGVEVITSSGSGSTQRDRLLAEQARGIYSMDINFFGASSVLAFSDAGALSEAMPLIMRPDILDRSKWASDKFLWLDRQQKYCPASELILRSNVGLMYYNKKTVRQAELDSLKSRWDLLKPRWKGKIAVILDPSGGAEISRTMLWQILGKKWYETLIREMNVTFLTNGQTREAVDSLARGQFDFLTLAPDSLGAAVHEAEKQGLPVAEFERTLAEGPDARISGRSFVMKNPPHPGAAQLFLNWWLSREGQTTRVTLSTDPDTRPSLRTDVPQGKVPDDAWALARTLKPKQLWSPADPKFAAAENESRVWFEKIFREKGLYGY